MKTLKFIGMDAKGHDVIELVQEGKFLFRRIFDKPYIVSHMGNTHFHPEGKISLTDFTPHSGTVFVCRPADTKGLRIGELKHILSYPVETIRPVEFFEDEIKGIKYVVKVGLSEKASDLLRILTRSKLFGGVVMYLYDETVTPPKERRILKVKGPRATFTDPTVSAVTDGITLYYDKDGTETPVGPTIGPITPVDEWETETDSIIRELTDSQLVARLESRQKLQERLKSEEKRLQKYVEVGDNLELFKLKSRERADKKGQDLFYCPPDRTSDNIKNWFIVAKIVRDIGRFHKVKETFFWKNQGFIWKIINFDTFIYYDKGITQERYDKNPDIEPVDDRLVKVGPIAGYPQEVLIFEDESDTILREEIKKVQVR